MKNGFIPTFNGSGERITPAQVLTQLRQQVRAGLIPVVDAGTDPTYQITHQGELALSPTAIITLNLPIEVVSRLPVEAVHAAFTEAIFVYSQPTVKKGDLPSSCRVY